LSGEFMGRHSNIILVSPEQTVLHAAKLITRRESRVREVLPGRAYIPPPAPERPDPRTVTPEQFIQAIEAAQPDDFAAWLGGQFEGISKFLAQEISARAADDDTPGARWQAFDAVFRAARQGDWQPMLLRDERDEIIGAYPIRLHSVPASRQEACDTIHRALEAYYARTIPRAVLEQQRRTLLGHLQKALSQRTHALEQVQQGVQERTRADQYRRWGELLLANLYQLKPGQDHAELLDYYSETPATIRVPLDATLTPQENAERYFQRARHVEANATRLQELQQKLAAEKSALEAGIAQVEQTTEPQQLEALREQAAARGWLQTTGNVASSEDTRRTPSFEGKRIRVFTSPEGWQVLVGENAEANDYLVQRVGAPNDWWLHVRAGTSAHVVIRTHNAPQKVPPTTLLFAAQLAAARSAGRHAGVVAVDYTLRKYVRKPRGSAPGQVTYMHEKTLHVSPAEEKDRKS
ncbi:MAG: NFACT family protein, partial [Armatimonadota bacterium]|nr:NFACT family protein [Armatimonadota bacterium]